MLNCCSHIPPFLASCTVFDHIFGIRPGRGSKCVTSWCFQCTLQDWLRTNPTNFLNTDSLYGDCFVHLRGYFQANAPSDQSLFVAAFVVQLPMPSWVCQWKPFWIPFGESFKKAFLEECVFTGDDPSDEQRVSEFLVLIHSTGNTDYTRDVHPPTPRPARQPDSLPWESTRPQDKAYFWERIEAHCLLYSPNATSSTKGSSVPFPERLELPFSSDEILSG